MKSIQLHRHGGFTLIELLVVIGIIALLASLAIPTANIVLRKAKETQARVGVQGIAVAVKQYQTEYNRLPNPNASGGGTSPAEDEITTDNSDMISTLLGKNDTYNPRQIAFYDPPTAKGGANGLIANGTNYSVVDPWIDPQSKQGRPYRMVLDYNGDHKLLNPVKQRASDFNSGYIDKEPDELTTDVGVYSDGDPNLAPTSRKAITSW